jgi:hypothetical protein
MSGLPLDRHKDIARAVIEADIGFPRPQCARVPESRGRILPRDTPVRQKRAEEGRTRGGDPPAEKADGPEVGGGFVPPQSSLDSVNQADGV